MDFTPHHAEITPDFENIQAALFWGFAHDPDRACLFAVSLDAGYMNFHQPHPVRHQLLEAALRAEGQSAHSQANTLQSLGDLALLQDDYAAAREHYAQALALARQIPDTVCQLNCLIGLARLERALGNREAACAQYAALFTLTDGLPAFANHPFTQQLKHEAAEYCGGQSETGAQPSPEQMARLQQLANMLIAWVQTPDWDASRAYLEQHQSELLTDEAETALQRLIQNNNNHPELVRHLELLRKARREGIAAAYAQFESGQSVDVGAMLEQLLNAFLRIPDSEAMAQFVAQVPAPLLDRFEQVLDQTMSQFPPEVQAALRERLEMLRRLRGR